MLIIMCATLAAVGRLHQLLDDFADATGLVINFRKSTLVPMHIADDELTVIMETVGYKVEGFPQTYLGLLLSVTMLTLADFPMIIAKVNKYLARWHARLLSPMGRLVLLNAMLDALPTYAMAALKLPPAVIQALDKLWHAFL